MRSASGHRGRYDSVGIGDRHATLGGERVYSGTGTPVPPRATARIEPRQLPRPDSRESLHGFPDITHACKCKMLVFSTVSEVRRCFREWATGVVNLLR